MKRFVLSMTSLILAGAGCFSPDYQEGIFCSEEGLCPGGMSCDPVDNRCRYDLLDPTCDDGLQNGDESDTDCGGICPACADGLACGAPGDCQSQVCQDDVCAVPRCGDGATNSAGEACDDAGESAACNADCTPADCGDGQVNTSAGETCDASGETETCDADCTAVSCGDGVANATAGEACDDGGDSATCNADCTPVLCGDLYINTEAGEDCDDGGETATCDADCTVALCGDSVVNTTAGEACDDGGDSATCDMDCTPAACGDFYANAAAGEVCDEGGNTAICDGDCTVPVCGDGYANPAAGEQCDDGNLDDGDGCDASCQLEILRSCAEILAADPSAASGFYDIDPDLLGPEPVMNVYCDMTYNGGGWTNLDFAGGVVYLENGNFAQCVQGLSGDASSVTCLYPHVNGDPGRWMYHYLCDGSDSSANYILDHMSPVLGHQISATIGGWTSQSQRYISEASLNNEEYCYIDGTWVHYTDPACALYNTPGNGNCAINEVIIRR